MSQPFWSTSAAELLQQLQTTAQGLTADEARARLTRYGANLLIPKKKSDALTLLLSQFKSPIILILFFATGLSFFLRDPVDAFIILDHCPRQRPARVLAGAQCRQRSGEVACHRWHQGLGASRWTPQQKLPSKRLCPETSSLLNAGDIIPGDCLVEESKDLFIDEATLTGESFPVEKSVGVLAAETALAHRTNALWMGTHVVSGSAKALGQKYRQANRVRQGLRAVKTSDRRKRNLNTAYGNSAISSWKSRWYWC